MFGVLARVFPAVGLAIVLLPLAAAHHNDTEEKAEAEPPPLLTLYHHYLLIERELRELQEAHPDHFKYYPIGKSVLGLTIYGAEITNLTSDPAEIEKRYRLYFDGSIHSNEQLGMEMVMDIARFLLDEYDTNATAKWIVDNRHTFIVPLVNPDGNVRDSRRNIRDVDLNRNFPAGWGGPGSTAKGSAPGSEPETQAIMAYLQTVRPHYLNSFHTGTLMLLHPYGNTDAPSPDHAMYTAVCESVREGMSAANGGREVPCGAVYTTIYPASGATVDYAYHEFGSNSWTFEVDDEQNLVFSQDPIRVRLGEAWEAVEHAFLSVERYGAWIRPMPIFSIVDGGRLTSFNIEFYNYGFGASNNTLVRVQVEGADTHQEFPIESVPPMSAKDLEIPFDLVVGQRFSLELSYNKTFYRGFTETQRMELEFVSDGGKFLLRSGEKTYDAVDVGPSNPLPGFELLFVIVSVAFLHLRRRSK